VTMPYTSLEGFEEDSVGMYIKIKDGWKYVEGEINKEERIVTAIIPNVNKYIKDEIELALMGVFCISCYRSSFTKVYQPGKGSKTSVILIHGFNPEPNTYQELIDDIKLTNQPFEVWTFDYPLSNLIEESMNELMSLLEKNHAAYENIYIVAHSLGGVIAQQALYNSYLENKRSLENKEPPAYNYLGKVRKVILVGTSNEGSPVVEVYRRLFGNLVNSKEHALFNPKSKVINDLAKGMITPRVPAIDYKVIAGTKTYEFNLVFFRLTTEKLADIYEKNDGIITVKSAQNIGGEYIDNQCEDYWEVNLTHTELIDDLLARRIIERIIAEDISEKDTALLGHNKYFDLSVRDNLAGDMYVIIGKKIIEEEVVDETGCKCGNGFCGEGENEINCPSDCARFLSGEKRNWLFALTIILAVSVIGFQYTKYKRFSHPHLKMMMKHIKTNYEIIAGKGYTHKQMKDAFLSRGWPKRTVNDTIELLRKEFHHHYHKPLKKHLKEHLKKGYRGEEIKRALIDAGWEGEAVEKVFKGEELEPTFKLKEVREYKGKLKGKRMYFGFNR